MASWPTERAQLGTRQTRLEGPLKVSGQARYTADQNHPGLLHGRLLVSPWGAAQITLLDLDPARRMPGVKAVLALASANSALRHHGQAIAAVAAETPAQAEDAIRAIRFSYDRRQPVIDLAGSLADDAPQVTGQPNARPADPQARGEVEPALARAAAVFTGEYTCQVQTHACLETHGAVAVPHPDGKLTVYCSTQAVGASHDGLARNLNLPKSDVEVICEHMGGGFGSKLGMDLEASVAARLARECGRPVKLMQSREGEQAAGGCRRLITAKVTLGADGNGRLVACDAVSHGSSGAGGRAGVPLPFIYNAPANRLHHVDLAINAGGMRAMRAPGHPLASFIMESAMEGLAHQMGLDPLELRRRNLPGNSLWQQQLTLGAERIGWADRPATGSQTGRYRRGLGVAVTRWGGRGHGSNTRVTVHDDGTVAVYCGTQDLGTGTRTAMALVAAETFGLTAEQITMNIGRASYPPSGGSGGSTTIGGVSSSCRVACETAAERILMAVAAAHGGQPADYLLAAGQVRRRGADGWSLPWARACALLPPGGVSADGQQADNLMGNGVNGCQFAAVEVDVETGLVKATKIVACQDCGLVVNRLTAESQVLGALVMGLGLALYEERVLDPYSGRMLNADLEFYKLPGPSDIPELEAHLQDQPERGPIGIGEPPAIPTAAAIANAVFNAIGVQVDTLPLTPDRVLTALGAVQEAR